jgi:hypothetical protein
MSETLQSKNNISQYNNGIIDFLNYKESKKEHIIYPETYVYSNAFYSDIKRIIQALEDNPNKSTLVDEKKSGNVIKNVRRVKISGIFNGKTHEEIMNMKMENCIPKFTIVYLSLSAFASGIFVVFFLLSLFKGINFLHPVMSLLFSIGFIGLFFTAFTSIYDWRKMLDGIK